MIYLFILMYVLVGAFIYTVTLGIWDGAFTVFEKHVQLDVRDSVIKDPTSTERWLVLGVAVTWLPVLAGFFMWLFCWGVCWCWSLYWAEFVDTPYHDRKRDGGFTCGG